MSPITGILYFSRINALNIRKTHNKSPIRQNNGESTLPDNPPIMGIPEIVLIPYPINVRDRNVRIDCMA